jgi:hypothetical protein
MASRPGQLVSILSLRNGAFHLPLPSPDLSHDGGGERGGCDGSLSAKSHSGAVVMGPFDLEVRDAESN